jgi:hypothetical protein
VTLAIARRYARFSVDRRYRYVLGREFEAPAQGDLLSGWEQPADRRVLLFVMLNPSVASERVDDPTLRRCMGFAHEWGGFQRLEVVNLFSLVATDPRELRRADDPIGPRTDALIRRSARDADRIVTAWGAHGGFGDRAGHVLALLRRAGRPLFHLGLTQDGHPRHPLYLPAGTPLQPW